ncbi:MAG: sigma-70 family RNA polymerase sigma factor [Melioribacteraceae bacterium]|nr:sigma-70 family RNA polymerase sigma factor [Melioribacteraceae bacterium]MCF8394227.1 sigma-70 family RNA polymerase sigma factor [Melioribacteraceae bacterium]MCF8419947.1 sigma-70 family RNA polymerase sigma factor [Melioribacteraceae bacterium]
MITKCKNGDASAFRTIVKSYNRQLFGYLFKLTYNRETAEDLLQETLMKVWHNIKSYDEKNRFASWLFTIAHNVAVDAFRKKKLPQEEYNDNIEFENSWRNNPHQEYVVNELTERLNIAVAKLSDKQKKVFLLRQHGGLSFKEIADLMNEPLNTVLSHMRYAVKKVKQNLRTQDAI